MNNRREFITKAIAATAGMIAAPILTKYIESLPEAEFLVLETKAVSTSSYANLTNQVACLKELYAGKMADLIYNENPFLQLVKKAEGFEGAAYTIPIVYSKNI